MAAAQDPTAAIIRECLAQRRQYGFERPQPLAPGHPEALELCEYGHPLG